MPYLKKEVDPLRRVLRGYDLDGAGLARVLGKAPGTGRARMEDPGSITVAELRTISRRAHIPIDELRAAI